jgi:hypothetical protein
VARGCFLQVSLTVIWCCEGAVENTKPKSSSHGSTATTTTTSERNSELALSLQRLDANGLRRVLERLLVEAHAGGGGGGSGAASSTVHSSTTTPNIVREFVRNELDSIAARNNNADRDWNSDYQSLLDDLKSAPQSQSLKYMSRYDRFSCQLDRLFLTSVFFFFFFFLSFM